MLQKPRATYRPLHPATEHRRPLGTASVLEDSLPAFIESLAVPLVQVPRAKLQRDVAVFVPDQPGRPRRAPPVAAGPRTSHSSASSPDVASASLTETPPATSFWKVDALDCRSFG